jgi:hypothetical protein
MQQEQDAMKDHELQTPMKGRRIPQRQCFCISNGEGHECQECEEGRNEQVQESPKGDPHVEREEEKGGVAYRSDDSTEGQQQWDRRIPVSDANTNTAPSRPVLAAAWPALLGRRSD